jgi:long-chain fatty acid transport protein
MATSTHCSGRLATSNRIWRKCLFQPLIVAIVWLATGSGQQARAAGFYLDNIGTPGSLGTAGAANVTNNWGPDAAWANPAGLVGIKGRRAMTTSLQVVAPTVEFDPDVAEAGGSDGGDAGDTALIPSFFYAQPLTDDWYFGFGVSALQGGGVDYGDDFAGRYGAIDVNLTGLGATWSMGYRVNERLSLGFGGTLVQTDFEQTIAVNQGPAGDGKVKFRDLDDLGIQGILGLQYRVTERLMLGLTYRSEFDAELEGNIKFRNFVLPLPSQTNLDLDWTNPQWLEAGLRLQAGGGFWFLRGNWQEWSEFSENQIGIDTNAGNIVQTLDRDWDDTWALGFAYASHPEASEGWSVGVTYESSAVDDDKRTIDLPVEENWQFSAAYGRMDRDKARGWSVGATLQVFGDAEVDQTAQGFRFAGEFEDYYIVYLGGTYRF